MLLRKNRAHARYCLWLAASAKFLVPFSLLMLVWGLVGRHSAVLPAPTRVPVLVEQVEEFAGVMQAHLDRPVVDQTGLKQRFDFQLQWTPDETSSASPGRPGEPPKPPQGADSFPDLSTAIQQQLGLKLESTKAQVDVLVIDKVEKPSEN